jgi:DNA replication and repair protein RecF
MVDARIRRLTLTNFRSYRIAQIEMEGLLVVLTGPNGAGKTNVLEAISLFAPGRGLRRAQLDEFASWEADGSWAVSADVEGRLGLATLGTGINPSGIEGAPRTRRCRIDREPVPSAAAFSGHLHVVWLVPAMDGLFSGPASDRRRFLDRLVLAVDPAHSGRVASLERALRSRNRLLEEHRPDPRWLDAIEHEAAELAVAVAALRAETIGWLNAVLKVRPEGGSPFPAAKIAAQGWMEELVPGHPAVEVEGRYRAILARNRERDAAAGRTLDGPHLTDLSVTYLDKNIPAAAASTGEQKALLIGLVLAQASLITDATATTPVLLLDEVVAHLDCSRRVALFGELDRLGAQVWMTGADFALFEAIADRAEVFEVVPGRVVPHRRHL